MKPLCIYHHNCADGFTAAWAVRQRFPDWEFHGATHGNAPPDVTHRDVVIVDFSYKRPVLEAMAQSARSILILDHHKSAAEDLAPFQGWIYGYARDPWKLTYQEVPTLVQELVELGHPPVVALFDMERSGARIAWDVFHPGQEPPQLLLHVEDRDLWRFALPGTREIQANLFSFPYDWETWDGLMENSRDPAWLRQFCAEGLAIERKHFKDIRELIASAQRRMAIAGHDVPALNAPYFFSSDAGHIMAQGEPFAACYWDTPEGRTFSLRSADDGLDVSEIATRYGGGGHKHAAGFRVEIGWEGE